MDDNEINREQPNLGAGDASTRSEFADNRQSDGVRTRGAETENTELPTEIDEVVVYLEAAQLAMSVGDLAFFTRRPIAVFAQTVRTLEPRNGVVAALQQFHVSAPADGRHHPVFEQVGQTIEHLIVELKV